MIDDNKKIMSNNNNMPTDASIDESISPLDVKLEELMSPSDGTEGSIDGLSVFSMDGSWTQ